MSGPKKQNARVDDPRRGLAEQLDGLPLAAGLPGGDEGEKAAGRKGTRRAWKRSHPPHRIWFYREPPDVMIIGERRIIATPRQNFAIQRAAALEEKRRA